MRKRIVAYHTHCTVVISYLSSNTIDARKFLILNLDTITFSISVMHFVSLPILSVCLFVWLALDAFSFLPNSLILFNTYQIDEETF